MELSLQIDNTSATEAAIALQQISSDPEKLHSHFIKLRNPDRKGQSRYRCVTCCHEFECTGKLRLIQHVLGSTYSDKQKKNVRSCPRPYTPLKEAMGKIYGPAFHEHQQYGNSMFFSADSSSASGTPNLNDYKSCSGNGYGCYLPVNSVDIRPPISFDSFYSTKSQEVHTTCEENSRSENNIYEFSDDTDATEEDFFAGLLRDVNFFEELTCMSTSNKRTLGNYSSPSTQYVFQQTDNKNPVYTTANKAVLQFFSNYRLPVHAVEDPLFLELLNAVRVAGPHYRPTMSTILHDTQKQQQRQQQQLLQQLNNNLFYQQSGNSTMMDSMLQQQPTNFSFIHQFTHVSSFTNGLTNFSR
jgi:hypothetical protein